jgi:MFS transporter, CP family, cyanate transporter
VRVGHGDGKLAGSASLSATDRDRAFVGGIIPASVLSSTSVVARKPQQVGTLQGLYVQGANLGQFVAPPIIASLVAGGGRWQNALFLSGAAAAGGVLVGWRLRKLGR